MDWISEPVFNFPVEKNEIPRSGGRPYLPNEGPLNLILHTTEGSTVAGALATLDQNVDPSHFVVGQGRIIQLRPVNAQAAALHDPMNVSCIQVEIVGFSQEKPWLPEDDTLEPLVGLIAYLSQNLNIPLVVPYDDWVDDLSDCPLPWAANNKRRKQCAPTYPKPYGVYGHIDIPNQQPSYHWDPGCLQISVILQKAQAYIAGNADAPGAGE
jgi:hypothetical protein